MKVNCIKSSILLIAVIFSIVSYLHLNTQAQDKKAAATTNWIGYPVVGQEELADPIAGRGPYPKADAQVQIGLRNDGTVVWRKSPVKK